MYVSQFCKLFVRQAIIRMILQKRDGISVSGIHRTMQCFNLEYLCEDCEVLMKQ